MDLTQKQIRSLSQKSEIWFFLWIETLRRNDDYGRYCIAQNESDRQLISQIQGKLLKQEIYIADLYDDIGDVRHLRHYKEMKLWLAQKVDLFVIDWIDYPDIGTVKKADAVINSEHSTQTIHLSHTLRSSKQQMMTEYEAFLEVNHSTLTGHLSEPQYRLPDSLTLNVATYENYIHALNVLDLMMRHDDYNDLMAKLRTEDESLHFHPWWTFDIDWLDGVLYERAYKFEDKNDATMRAELIRWHKLGKKLIDNSLRPVFAGMAE